MLRKWYVGLSNMVVDDKGNNLLLSYLRCMGKNHL